MIPTDSGKTQPCSPISSNCVIWQGPDIACINICNGDSVSDVVAALATELCDLIDKVCECNPDVSAVDLKCAIPAGGVAPTTLDGMLQAIIDYLCALTPGGGASPILPLPQCLQYRDNLGNDVVELELLPWATLIGNSICTLIESIGILEQNIQNILARVEILEACVLPCDPSSGQETEVVSSCILRGELVTVSTLLLALETEFCQLSDVIGSVSLINNAINQGNCLNATSPSLNGIQSLGDLGWTANQTLAETTQNQWIAICDLYSAVSDIQNNCCDDGCDTVNILYTYSLVNAGSVPVGLNISFTASSIPAGYTDCGSAITVTDSQGSSITNNLDVVNLSQTGASPLYIDLTVGSLDVLNSLVIQLNSCVGNGTSQCESSTSIVVPLTLPCPTSISAIPSAGSISVSFNNTLGGSVSYTIEVFETNNPAAILGTITISNPGTSISELFSGAAPATNYTVQVTVSSSNATVTCDPVNVITLGVSCSTIQTIASGAVLSPTAGSYFLGKSGDFSSNTGIYYYYDPAGNDIEMVQGLGTSICAAPILSGITVDVTGVVDLTAAWGSGVETSIDLSYSIDGITYIPANSGADGARTFPTTLTSGSIYIKGVTDCGSGTFSEAYIARYDFSTGSITVISSPSECLASQLDADECPVGVEVAQQYLDCEGVNIAVPGAPLASYWFYIGKIIDGTGVTRYMYAGWTAGGALSKVVLCCACPAFILTDTIRVFAGAEKGYVTDITIPYVMGDGNPVITIYGGGPLGGNLTQVLPGGAFFRYATTEKTPNNYGDVFQVSIDTEVAGTCSTAIATIQIQIIPPHSGIKYTDEDLYVFIHADAVSFSAAQGAEMKLGFTALKTYWNAQFGYTGDIYWIPTSDPKWLGYPKSILDDGTSITLNPDAAWVAQRNLPTSWTGGAAVNKRRASVIVLVNDASTDYHASIGNDFSTQVTTDFKADFEAFNDMHAGTAVSAWAQGFGVQDQMFKDGLSFTLMPLTVDGSNAADSACLLQMLAAVTGEVIPTQKYGIQTLTDTSLALSLNPYAGAVTNDGTALQSLFDYTDSGSPDAYGVFALLDQVKTASTITDFSNGNNEEIKYALDSWAKGNDNTYPASALPVTDTFLVKACPGSLGGSEDEYFVKITGHSYGTIPEGTVLTLQNDGADYAGPKDPWNGATGTGAVQAIVTVINNNLSAAYEINPASIISIGLPGDCI